MIFETHAHYDDEQFDQDRDEILRSMAAGGIGTIVNVSASYDSCRRVVDMVQAYPFMYAAVGVHPDAGLPRDSGLCDVDVHPLCGGRSGCRSVLSGVQSPDSAGR